MAWNDIAWIVVACTSANHLGLITEIERIIHHRIPVVNCVKCSTFWATLIYCIVCCESFFTHLPLVIALSFLAAYAAVWLELIMYFIDTLYNRIYETLSKQNNEEPDTD